MFPLAVLKVIVFRSVSDCSEATVKKICMYSRGGPIHARVPIHAHPQFSQRFVLFHGKDVYHIIDNDHFDHIHM